MVCENIHKEGDTSKTPPNPPLPPKWNKESVCPTPMASLPPYSAVVGCCPLQQLPRGRSSSLERIHVPFRLNDHKEIKQDLGSFTNDPD
jgi:hypothetical protein